MVVVLGVTARVPVPLTSPIPLISTESAFSTFQDNVEDWPAVIVVGFAVKLMTRGAAPSVT